MKHQFKNLVWFDDFDGAELDRSKWECAVDAFGGGNNELQMYTDRLENVRVERSCLVIEARRELVDLAGSTRHFSSARLRTKHRGDWLYGRFEVRAKLPAGRGLWPAIWMLPTDDFYGTWAASGEIDIMESKGQYPRIFTNALCYGGRYPRHRFSSREVRRSSHEVPFTEAFHVYSLEWTEDGLEWAVDGMVTFTMSPKEWGAKAGSHAPFDKRFHLLLNLAVGGNHPGAPDRTTPFPARFEVDWVRVYQ
jgi:beta-glucanase (GH16 family)